MTQMLGSPSTGGNRRPRAVKMIAVVLALAGVIAGLALLLKAGTTIVAEGKLRPWGGDDMRLVELLGIRIYLDGETRPSPDLVTAWCLFAIGAIGCLGAVLVGRAHGRTESWRFLIVAAVAGSYLGADEALGLHETLGHNLPFLVDLPGVERPDDVIVAGYAVVAIAVAVVFRRVLVASPAAKQLMFVAIGLAVLASLLDFLTAPEAAEEGTEAAATLCALAAFIALTADLAIPRRRRADG